MPLKGDDRGLAFERQVLFEDSESRREAGYRHRPVYDRVLFPVKPSLVCIPYAGARENRPLAPSR